MAEDHGPIGTFSYEIILEATDSTGLKSTTSVNLPVGSDTSPPSPPTGLTATAAGSGQVNLDWTASTDNVGVSGYRVERCQGAGCTNFAQVGTPDGDRLQRHRPGALDHLPLPGAGGRRRPATSAAYSTVAEATTPVAPPTPPGLVGAWAFNEGSGTTTADASGKGNHGNLDRRHLDDSGPLRQRPELQRLEQRGPGRRLGLARSDHGDDPLGLDPADGQPERMANHPPAPDRLLLPQRQQQRRTAAPLGRRDLRHQHHIRERSDRQSGQRLDPRGPHLRRRHPAAVRQRRPGRHAARRPARSRPPTTRSGSAATPPTASTSPGSSTRSASTTARSPRPTSRPT